jgi:hypothetical protein
MIPLTIANCGSVSGYSVTVKRRDAVPQDGYHGRTSLAVTVTKDGTSFEAVVLDDTGSDAPRHARFAGLAVLKTIEQIGA